MTAFPIANLAPIMKSSLLHSPATASRRSVFFDRFDEVFHLGLESMHLRCVRIRDETAQYGDALDQFGYALNQQKRESDDDQRLGRPLRQPARIARLLVDLERAHEERAPRYNHDDR